MAKRITIDQLAEIVEKGFQSIRQEMMESSMNGILIRPASASDWSALWPLLIQMGKTDSEEAVGGRCARIVEQSEHFLPVALVSGNLAGYAWAQDFGSHLRSGLRVVRLHDLFVDPSWRRRGIGTDLSRL